MTRRPKPRILIIDDEPDLGEVLTGFLNHDFDAVYFTDGRKALEAFDRESFDLVLTDMVMPFPDGAQVLDHVNRSNKHTPVVIMSGKFNQDSTFDDPLRFPCKGRLAKPFPPVPELVDFIWKALDSVT